VKDLSESLCMTVNVLRFYTVTVGIPIVRE
jgi:hypothetical protein